MFSYAPAAFELLAGLGRKKFIYDFDDAVFHTYDKHANPLVRRLLGKKISAVIKSATYVFAGNDYLAAYARKVNRNVIVLPTVIDLQRYPASATNSRNSVFTLGWIGSPFTVDYLKNIRLALQRFAARRTMKLVLIGSGNVELPGVDVQIREWSEETEVEQIRGFDVGLMPLPNNFWVRGKCGFKIIQYMACGLPVVASPIGANIHLVDHGKTGFLASSQDEWVQYLEQLYNDRNLRQEMGRKGRMKIEEGYCLDKTAPRFLEAVRQCVE
jgi:glycosyltransferase involved in cell wall biosynthesis